MQINNTNKYHIIVNKSPEGGYSGQCLELAGAISEGETEEELFKNMTEAIQLVLESIESSSLRMENDIQNSHEKMERFHYINQQQL